MARISRDDRLEDVERELDRVLEGRGPHLLLARWGCALAVVACVAGLVLFAVRQYEAMLGAGVVSFLAYFLGTSADPGLAKDPRVGLARALVAGLRDRVLPDARVRFELDLVALEATAPLSKEPRGRGRLEARYAQEWLRLEAPLGDGRDLTITARSEGTMEEDGIRVLSRATRDALHLALHAAGAVVREERVERPTPCGPEDAAALLRALEAS